jgi:lipopolysaccharide biosynthesis glycosyltransferase
MRNLIYQYWYGVQPFYAMASSVNIKAYADLVGADYRCDINKPFIVGSNVEFMNCLRPIQDPAFDEYDNVLFLDMDIFATENAQDNIFDVSVDGVGMVQEVLQPDLRQKSSSRINGVNDKIWAAAVKKRFGIDVPVDHKNRPLVYNSGVVMYTKEARQQARRWMSYEQYRGAVTHLDRFYQLDQNYLGAVVFSGETKFTELDIKWNSQVYYTGNNEPRDVVDNRVDQTVFVHLQTRPRNIMTNDMIDDIVNKPVSEWRHR